MSEIFFQRFLDRFRGPAQRQEALLKQCTETFPCQFHDLGLIDYSEALHRQKQAVEAVINGEPQSVLLCEHPPVLTLGRLGTENNILTPQEHLRQRGIQVLRTDRGGEVTLHAPGQLVIYPILDLNFFGRDLKTYLVKLEQVAIDLLRDFDIVASGIPGQRGVWVNEQKIASIGIGVRKWVSYHGMAVNVHTDLDLFSLIKPCGLDVTMTSIERIQGRPADMGLIKIKIIDIFSKHFHLRRN